MLKEKWQVASSEEMLKLQQFLSLLLTSHVEGHDYKLLNVFLFSLPFSLPSSSSSSSSPVLDLTSTYIARIELLQLNKMEISRSN
ncbi:hypothetical protein E2C01_016040 [Portunus trituberculatus]|uniref:Uncharacterized protein n=1 Tax=Portunus trituberculatus TaxID=210409 RepID=A0A5B7DQ03_PORTR|nr:hypothetical protein [Portunus trituberculatus]